MVTVGVLLGIDLRQPAKILANTSVDPDTDGDGLVDRQERILGTLLSATDTDGDGYSDSEELARQSSPVYPQFVPELRGLSTGLTAHGERDGIHAVIAVYIPNGRYRDVDLHVGTLVGRHLVVIPPSSFLPQSSVSFVPARDPNAIVALVDFRFDQTWVEATGHLTMYATVGRNGSGTIAAADVIDLFEVAGVPVLAMPDPNYLPAYDLTGGGHEQGTIYQPLTGGGDDVPAGWSPNQVCFQTSEEVGASGAVVTHEIVTAECESGWDGSCPPNCHGSVGSTYTSIDPIVLVGG
jgi:hypothetical protein